MRRMERGGRGRRGAERVLLRGVQLTDAQRTRLQALHQQYLGQVRALLTPEQQRQFDANRAAITPRKEGSRRGR